MILIPLVPIVLMLVSFSFTASQSLNEDGTDTFNIKGVVLCRKGKPFPTNKEVFVEQHVRTKGDYSSSDSWPFDIFVNVSGGGHFSVDVPIYIPVDNEEIWEHTIAIRDDREYCSEDESQYYNLVIKEQNDQDAGKVELKNDDDYTEDD